MVVCDKCRRKKGTWCNKFHRNIYVALREGCFQGYYGEFIKN